MTNYDLDEIRRLWKKEPNEWILKAATTKSSGYPPEVLDIIIEEAVSRGLIQYEEAALGLEINEKDKVNKKYKLPENMPSFKDNTFRVRFLQTLLVISVILWCVAVYSGIQEYNLLHDIKYDLFDSEGEKAVAVEANDIFRGIIGLSQMILVILTLIFFMMWAHRSNKNTMALIREPMQFTPGWSVGWFFVPVANLWKPYQAIKEVWEICSKHSNSTGFSIVGLWWTFWLLSSSLAKATMKLDMRAEEIDEIIRASVVGTISDSVDIVMKILMFIMISKVFLMQSIIREQQNQTYNQNL